jgi:hypothetical protein
MAKTTPPRTIQCYHCRHRFKVSGRAMTTSCPKCSKPLMVDDVIVKTFEAVRKIQTCGRIVIQKKGHVIASLVEANGGVEVEGILEAKVVSGGPVRIGPKAMWKGDCNAPSLSVDEGCKIAGGYFVIPDNSLGLTGPNGEPSEAPPDEPRPAGPSRPPAPRAPTRR